MEDNKVTKGRSSAFDALLMAGFVFSFFTFICLVTKDVLLGAFGSVYANFILGAFGFVSYGVMPIVGIYCVLQLFTKTGKNTGLILLSAVLYMLGATMIFHIPTSASASVFAQSMSYAEYINESYFLSAQNGATAGGAFVSAILFHVIANVGIVGGYIFSGMFLLLGTVGIFFMITRGKPKKAKAPKALKAKKKKAIQEDNESEIPENFAREEYSTAFEDAPREKVVQKRYNKLGMEIINPVFEEEEEYVPSHSRMDSIFPDEPRSVAPQKSAKLHVINIDEPKSTTPKRRGRNSAQDILFNGEESENQRISSHNKVRNLSSAYSSQQPEPYVNPIMQTTKTQAFVDVFARNTAPQEKTILSDLSGDFKINPSSTFGIVGEAPTEDLKESIVLPKEDATEESLDEKLKKSMFDHSMPRVTPKILTMADLEEEKAEQELANVEEEKTLEEIMVEEALSEEERIEKLKEELLSPADASDMDKLKEIYPKQKTDNSYFKPAPNAKILTRVNQIEGYENYISKAEEPEIIVEETAVEEVFESPKEVPQPKILTLESLRKEQEEQLQQALMQNEVVSRTTFESEEVNEETVGFDFSSENLETAKEETISIFDIATPGESFVSASAPQTVLNFASEKPAFEEETERPKKPYIAPSVDLLEDVEEENEIDYEEIENNAKILEEVLEKFNIPAKVVEKIIGPAVTKYELEMPHGIQVKRVESYSRDISLWLKSPSEVIIEAPIPGKNRVGIEVPNKFKQVVSLKEVIRSHEFTSSKSKTVFALGKDVAGKNIICDIKEMPHLLIAGATGMGKSVCLNTLITSLIYHTDPSDLRMLLIDPKKVEFISYKGVPHLLINEIISDNEKAILALGWAIEEMERRYTMFESIKQKDMDSYNTAIANLGGKKLPRIVIVVDEVADLMSINKKEIEGKIQRLTQKARAAGIHLVLATQRPSVDVITGVIKTNLPSRIAFKLSNGIDSKTVIDEGGAEKLLGRGDMFYRPCNWPAKVRVQGCFVSTKEVDNVIDFVIANNEAEFDEQCYNAIFAPNKRPGDSGTFGKETFEVDEYFKEAVRYAIESGNITISSIQRRFGLGFPRAAKIFDAMMARGFIVKSVNGKNQDVLIGAEGFEEEFGEAL